MKGNRWRDRLPQHERLNFLLTNRLKPGARPIDPDPRAVVSPCDAVVGAHGPVCGTEVLQAKGFPYALEELLGDARLGAKYRDGVFATLWPRSQTTWLFPCAVPMRDRPFAPRLCNRAPSEFACDQVR